VSLVNLLHARHLTIISFQWWDIIVSIGSSRDVIDTETQLDHAVDARSKVGWIVEREARGEQGSVEDEPHKILDGLVVGIDVGLLAQLLHDGVLGVDLHSLARAHVGRHGVVTQSLCPHDALHVGAPAELTGDQHARRVDDALTDDDLLDLVAENVLDGLAEVLVLRLDLLLALLLVLRVGEVEVLLGDVDELLAVVLLELLHGVLIDGVDEEQHLEVLALEALEERRVLDGLAALAGDKVDVLLVLLHALDVVTQRRHLFGGLGRVVAQQVGELGAVGRVLVHAELDVLREGLVELLKVLLVLGNLVEALDAALDEVLADDLEDLVLLQRLARDVERQVLRVDDALDKVEPLGNQLLAVVHDEDAAHVELDVVELLARLEHVEGRAAWHEQARSELELTLERKVLDGQVLLPVVGERLVERGVLLLGDVLGVGHPDRLVLVDQLPLVRGLLDLLGLLGLVGGGLVGVFVLVGDVLDLHVVGGLVGIGVGGLVGSLVLLVLLLDLLLGLLGDPHRDGVLDELGVLLDQVLDLALLQVLLLVLLHVQNNARAATQWLALGIGTDRERTAGGRLPDQLLVVVVLGGDGDRVGNQVGRVEADTELSNHRHIGARLDGLHELLGARVGNGTEAVDQVALGHADAAVLDRQCVLLLVGSDVDEQLGLRCQLALVSKTLVTDLVQRIASVRDQFSQEDFLVAVERVDNQAHKLIDLSLEFKLFSHV
jgi:hypothetical protein